MKQAVELGKNSEIASVARIEPKNAAHPAIGFEEFRPPDPTEFGPNAQIYTRIGPREFHVMSRRLGHVIIPRLIALR
ncbi:unnamed protein product [Echinostoma caproni]|uniref:CoA transferase n=1 Tax=Echinostoma caproni TaxID=27848 RepID=A0A183A8K5_9TREM|nr:unnamed protein product [Echinostoma caproni]